MSSFWKSGTGNTITGAPDAAFTPEFTIIPNGTMALAKIKSFELIEKAASTYAEASRFYQVTWKIVPNSDYANREVTQKIKPFEGTPEQIDRNLNMLKLIMDLCQYRPTHDMAPDTNSLMPMVGKICGIKIREWAMPKKDGSGMMEGNFVSEVHPAQGFVSEVGVKMEVVSSIPQSALQRNPRGASSELDLIDDIPF